MTEETRRLLKLVKSEKFSMALFTPIDIITTTLTNKKVYSRIILSEGKKQDFYYPIDLFFAKGTINTLIKDGEYIIVKAKVGIKLSSGKYCSGTYTVLYKIDKFSKKWRYAGYVADDESIVKGCSVSHGSRDIIFMDVSCEKMLYDDVSRESIISLPINKINAIFSEY